MAQTNMNLIQKAVSLFRGLSSQTDASRSPKKEGLDREPRCKVRIGVGEAIAPHNDTDFEIDIYSVADLTLPQLINDYAKGGYDDIDLAVSYRANDILAAYPNSNIVLDARGWIFVRLSNGSAQIGLNARISQGWNAVESERDEAIEIARRIVELYGFDILSTSFASDDFLADVLELYVRPSKDITLIQAAYLQCIIKDCTVALSQYSPVSIIQAVLNGHADRLIGVRENSCFDAKLKHYDRSNDLSRLSFASDVAAFANSPGGGLLLLGAKVTNSHEGDIVTSVPGCERDPGAQASYQSTVDNLIAPRVAGLSYYVAPHRNDHEIFMIFVPPQPPSALPFIVKGGVINNGKYTSSMFSVPIRQQDCNISARLYDVQRYLSDRLP